MARPLGERVLRLRSVPAPDCVSIGDIHSLASMLVWRHTGG